MAVEGEWGCLRLDAEKGRRQGQNPGLDTPEQAAEHAYSEQKEQVVASWYPRSLGRVYARDTFESHGYVSEIDDDALILMTRGFWKEKVTCNYLVVDGL